MIYKTFRKSDREYYFRAGIHRLRNIPGNTSDIGEQVKSS